jgi:hypothetical protein
MFVCQAQHTIIKLRFYSSSSNKGIQTSAILARPHSPPPMPEEQGTELFTWGQGVLGQLGHGDEKPQNQPRLIVSFLGTNVKAVSCGNQHTAVLLESGEAYSFGRGNFGQLSLGSLQVSSPLHALILRACRGTSRAALEL